MSVFKGWQFEVELPSWWFRWEQEDNDHDSDDSLDDIADFGDLCPCRTNRDDDDSMVKFSNKFYQMGQWFHFNCVKIIKTYLNIGRCQNTVLNRMVNHTVTFLQGVCACVCFHMFFVYAFDMYFDHVVWVVGISSGFVTEKIWNSWIAQYNWVDSRTPVQQTSANNRSELNKEHGEGIYLNAKECNCYKKKASSLTGKCFTEGVIYHATEMSK